MAGTALLIMLLCYVNMTFLLKQQKKLSNTCWACLKMYLSSQVNFIYIAFLTIQIVSQYENRKIVYQ